VAAASYYLPPYELQQLAATLAGLRAARGALAASSQPRKFSFRRKPTEAAAPRATAPSPPAPEPLRTPSQPEEPSSSGSAALSRLRGQVVRLSREEVSAQEITLSDLEDCTVVLPGAPAALFAHKLRRCRIFCGPVAGGSLLEGAAEPSRAKPSRRAAQPGTASARGFRAACAHCTAHAAA
jgi:hypothetical protein